MHLNTPNCAGCETVLNKYPGFYQPLRDWFYLFRLQQPDAHCSWAGRGKADQELFYRKGLSRAHYGQSAHNYNSAIDLFRLTQTNSGLSAQFDTPWYKSVVGPAALLSPNLQWYGAPGAPFYEPGHVEWKDWKLLRNQGLLRLVEQVE